MDGASSQIGYRQVFADSYTATDSDLSMASLVPSRLTCISHLFRQESVLPMGELHSRENQKLPPQNFIISLYLNL